MKAYALQFAEQDDVELWTANGEREADYCTQDGAQSLKAKIEAYWAERGQHVLVSLQNVGFHPAIRAARFDVRSDMVNGKPRDAHARTRRADPAEALDRNGDDLSFE